MKIGIGGAGAIGGLMGVKLANAGEEVIEWIAWYVSIDYEGGEPRIVALTFDAWSP